MSTPFTARLAASRPTATVAILGVSVTTAIGMSRLFSDWSYLRPMLFVIVGLHLTAWLLRVTRWPAWAALPALFVLAGELLAVAYYRGTMAGPFPTGRTLDMARLDAVVLTDEFATAVAPVPSTGSFAIAATVALALSAVLADSFAFRAQGRVEAVVPAGVLFVLTAALGVDRSRVGFAALWLAAAFVAVAILRFDARDDDASWMGSRRLRLAAAIPAIALTAGAGAVAAAAIGPRLPGAGEKALVDTRNRRGSVTEVVSPLVDIRATLVNRGQVEMFTVDPSDGRGHYWRLIGLPEFDGSAWNPPEESLVEMGNRADEILAPAIEVEQLITITGMRGPLVPGAFRPTQISPSAVYWAADSESLVLPDGNLLQAGDEIRVLSAVPNLDSDLLRAATTSGAPAVYYELPSDLPAVVSQTALEVTASAATPYDKALTLQQWFQSDFVYDATVQLGNSTNALEAFLRDRRGFCQQFSGTFAVMARTLGIPARVAVGFTPGDLGSDGLFHVYGRHAHAWPELWFDGIGWVPFEPTPGRGSADSEDYTGVAPGQDTTGGTNQPGGTPGPATTVAPRPVNSTVDGGGQGPSTGGVPTPRPDDAAAASASTTGTARWLVWAVLALLGAALWALLLPALVGWWSRRKVHSSHERVVRAWHRARGALEVAGAPTTPGATPLEYAAAAERSVSVDWSTVRDLAGLVTTAVYAPTGVDDRAAADSERLSHDVRAMCREACGWRARLRMRVDPRLVRRLAEGAD